MENSEKDINIEISESVKNTNSPMQIKRYYRVDFPKPVIKKNRDENYKIKGYHPGMNSYYV